MITTGRRVLGTGPGPGQRVILGRGPGAGQSGQGHLGLGTRPSIQAFPGRVVGGQTASGKGGRMLPPSEAPSKDETL